MSVSQDVVCTRCGHRRADDDAMTALTWVVEGSGEAAEWLCPACARTHVRDIEGKLPHEYW